MEVGTDKDKLWEALVQKWSHYIREQENARMAVK